jgi:hypothetical protein
MTVPKYLFIYHQPEGYVLGADRAAVASWQSFFEGIAGSIVDPGQPVSARQALGEVGSGAQLGGYSVVEAENLDSAMSLAAGCASLEYGGGVQVGELVDLPPDHIASQLRERVRPA